MLEKMNSEDKKVVCVIGLGVLLSVVIYVCETIEKIYKPEPVATEQKK